MVEKSEKRKHNFAIILLLLFGFALRLTFFNSIGLQDSEYWRAWMSGVKKYGPMNVYQLTECKENLIDIFNSNNKDIKFPYTQKKCQTVLDFKPNAYYREKYPLVQPQIYNIDLALTNQISKITNNDYLAISLLNTLYVLLMIPVMWFILLKSKVKNKIIPLLLFTWANPFLILNGNIQLYKDTLLVFILLGSLLFWIKNHSTLSLLLFGTSLIYKPTSLFLSPFYFSTYRWKILIASIPLLLVFFMHYINGTLMGYLAAIYSISDSMLMHGAEGYGFFKFYDMSILTQKYTGLDIGINELLKRIFTILSLAIMCYSLIQISKIKIKSYQDVKSAEIVIFYLFIIIFFRFGIQVNHWMIIIPLLIYLILFSKKYQKNILILLALYFYQDLTYGAMYRGSWLEKINHFTHFNQIVYFLVSAYLAYWLFLKHKELHQSLNVKNLWPK
jgi:hypothetical protein